jgi:hypothetical protein
MISPDIEEYNQSQDLADIAICETLAKVIDANLKSAICKVWHRHPVWFMDGNPIVGYSKQKAGIHLMFWSGQSFDEPLLAASGSFKAAGITYDSLEKVDQKILVNWLMKGEAIQWDYKNIVKRKGVLERLK